ncbi:hypothetical protein Plhal304r1_c071g0159761 [Plasmopara halstedii]
MINVPSATGFPCTSHRKRFAPQTQMMAQHAQDKQLACFTDFTVWWGVSSSFPSFQNLILYYGSSFGTS